MRRQEEIQKAHDMLRAVVIGEVPNPQPDAEPIMRANLDVLCWVLEHDHNKTFTNNVQLLDEALVGMGFQMCRSPVPFVGDPPAEEVLHEASYQELHDALDRAMACYMEQHPGLESMPGNVSCLQLMMWVAEQMKAENVR